MDSLDERKMAAAKVKNKAPAPIQITAEQLLQEATARLSPAVSFSEKARKRAKLLADKRDVGEYRERERKAFEDNLRRNRGAVGVWIRYARFEEQQHDFERARSIYERALDVDPRNITLWLRYAEMEMQCRNVNLARNVWDRAVTVQPRVDQFWHKYAYMEEQCGEVGRAAEVWERWMAWEPEARVHWAYIRFLQRHKLIDVCRRTLERLLGVHPDAEQWTRAARWEEEQQHDVDRARSLFERALDVQPTPTLFVEFARFEVRRGEIERGRAIYKLGMQRWAMANAPGLFHSYAAFERQHGTANTIASVVAVRKRAEYAARLEAEPLDYDTWHAYVALEEEQANDPAAVCEIYERAIAAIPPSDEKRHWRRYIYLWLAYAAYEELVVGSMEQAEAVLRAALQVIPHRSFTFSKVWLALATLCIRRADLDAFRRVMGQALGVCPKRSLVRAYISFEQRFGEFARCRHLHERWISLAPSDALAYCSYAEFEAILDERDRARAIFSLASSLGEMDQPEMVWRTWIDAEYEWGEPGRVEAVYDRLLERTKHIKVWLAYARFHYNSITDGPADEDRSSGGEQQQDGVERARQVMERAFKHFKSTPETRLLLLESWLALEQSLANGIREDGRIVQSLQVRFPRRIKRRRVAAANNEVEEEYWELHFPDDDIADSGAMRLLEMAHAWKSASAGAGQQQ